MNNLEIYDKVRSVPKEAQKTIEAGNIKGFTENKNSDRAVWYVWYWMVVYH